MAEHFFWHIRRVGLVALSLVAITGLVPQQSNGDPSASLARITTPSTQGSGVVVWASQSEAVVLTSYHVIRGATTVAVSFAADTSKITFNLTIPKDLAGWQTTDETYGLAALRVRANISPQIRAAKFGLGSAVRRGDSVVYWGYPNRSVSLLRFAANVAGVEGTTLILDRAIDEGGSGGGIFKEDLLIGIASSRGGQTSQAEAAMSDIASIALRSWSVAVNNPSEDLRREPATPTVRPPGTIFRDCPECPQMVIVPSGRYKDNSSSRKANATTTDLVTRYIDVSSFAISRHEISVAEYLAFAKAKAPSNDCVGGLMVDKVRLPDSPDSSNYPQTCVDWFDATEYTSWLSERTKQRYRLPSEAEWEYAARAGADDEGDNLAVLCNSANVYDLSYLEHLKSLGVSDVDRSSSSVHACKDRFAFAAPVGSMSRSTFGLQDMLGNVAEWTLDCWDVAGAGRSRDSRPHVTGSCDYRIVRGGHYLSWPGQVGFSFRDGILNVAKMPTIGIRVVRELP